jgi:hypothetical protein
MDIGSFDGSVTWDVCVSMHIILVIGTGWIGNLIGVLSSMRSARYWELHFGY